MMLLLKIVLLFFAVGLAMALLVRLTRIQQKLADLHKELQKNDGQMAEQRREIERQGAARQAEDEPLN